MQIRPFYFLSFFGKKRFVWLPSNTSMLLTVRRRLAIIPASDSYHIAIVYLLSCQDFWYFVIFVVSVSFINAILCFWLLDRTLQHLVRGRVQEKLDQEKQTHKSCYQHVIPENRRWYQTYLPERILYWAVKHPKSRNQRLLHALMGSICEIVLQRWKANCDQAAKVSWKTSLVMIDGTICGPWLSLSCLWLWKWSICAVCCAVDELTVCPQYSLKGQFTQDWNHPFITHPDLEGGSGDIS